MASIHSKENWMASCKLKQALSSPACSLMPLLIMATEGKLGQWLCSESEAHYPQSEGLGRLLWVSQSATPS